jgi:hypothetical protein
VNQPETKKGICQVKQVLHNCQNLPQYPPLFSELKIEEKN